jgi:hypothetical protein
LLAEIPAARERPVEHTPFTDCRRMLSPPEIVEVSPTQLEEVLRRVEQALTEEDAALIRAVFQSYVSVTDLVEDKNTSIRRLRQMLFGARTEKTDALMRRETEKPYTTGPSDLAARTAETAGEPASGTRARCCTTMTPRSRSSS